MKPTCGQTGPVGARVPSLALLLMRVISLYYYARILKSMFLDKAHEEASAGLTVSPYYVTLLAVLVVPTVFLGVYWAPLADFANYSVEFLRAL